MLVQQSSRARPRKFCVDEKWAFFRSVGLRWRYLANSFWLLTTYSARKALSREESELLDRGCCSLPARSDVFVPTGKPASNCSVLFTMLRWADGFFRAYDEVWGALGGEL